MPPFVLGKNLPTDFKVSTFGRNLNLSASCKDTCAFMITKWKQSYILLTEIKESYSESMPQRWLQEPRGEVGRLTTVGRAKLFLQKLSPSHTSQSNCEAPAFDAAGPEWVGVWQSRAACCGFPTLYLVLAWKWRRGSAVSRIHCFIFHSLADTQDWFSLNLILTLSFSLPNMTFISAWINAVWGCLFKDHSNKKQIVFLHDLLI